MFQRNDIREGMVVRSLDGEKLGRVFAVGDRQFEIEKGLFFPKDYLASYADIQDIRDDEIILSRGRDSLGDVNDSASANVSEPALGATEASATRPSMPGATDTTRLDRDL